MDMSIALQCVSVGAHSGILVGLVLLSCTRAGPINQINLREWMKMEGWVMEEGAARRKISKWMKQGERRITRKE